MPQTTPRKQKPSRDAILSAALTVADRTGWEALRLHQVAAERGCGLDDIRRHFPEKDALIDAWLDRADSAMLTAADRGELDGLGARDRLARALEIWLAALHPYRRVTREMIDAKLEPGHVHIQLPAVFRISRTVQWWRETARLDAPLPRRALEETALTTLFVTVFLGWLRDDSTEFRVSRRRLAAGLDRLALLGAWVPGGRFSAVEAEAARASEASPP